MANVTEILLSSDRFTSEVLAESVRAEGYRVELVHDDSSSGIGMPGLQSRLMVTEHDAPAVREVLSRSYSFGEHDGPPLDRSKRKRKVRILFAVWGLIFALAIALVVLQSFIF